MGRSFNGSSDRIDYGNIKATSGAQTFSCWIWSDNTTVGDERFFCQHILGDGGYAILNQFVANNRIEFVGGTSGLTLKSYTDNGAFPSGEWFHYLYTWDGSLTAANVHQYINNVEASYSSQDNGSGTMDAPAGSWSFGYIPADANLDGDLAAVGWWDRVLTADERAALAKGFSPLCIPRNLKFGPDLVEHQRDPISGEVGVLDGTAFAWHPHILQPARPQIGIPSGISCTATPTALAALATLQTPVIVDIQYPGSFSALATLHAPTIVVDPLVVTPSTLAAVATIHAPLIALDVTILPATLAALGTLLTPESLVFYVDIPHFMHQDLIDPYSGGAWLWLVEIAVPGYDTKRIARNTEDLTYGLNLYDKFNLQIGEQMFSGDGSIPRVTLRVFQDVNRVIEDMVNATEGALGAGVKLIRVCEKFLDTPIVALEADYDNLASESDTEWVTFTLGIPNPLTQRIPLRIYSSSGCPWATPTLFKGPECQYSGGDGTCSGTYEDCYVKGNAVHWGGELGLDPNVLRV